MRGRRFWVPGALTAALFVATSTGAGGASGAAGAANDPGFAQQWGLPVISAPAAWATSTGAGVLIGVVDTGADLAHEDLAGKVAAAATCIGTGGDERKCTTGHPQDGQDDQGHGTHVSGIAAALTNNRLGVASVAPDAKLVVAKSLDSSGSGYDDDVAAGIHWVVDHGGQTTNISHSGATPFLHDAIEYAWAHGAISVLAAGNYAGLGLGLFSADYGNLDAVVVGATDRNDHVALYSSDLGNAKWTILAPGGSGTLNQQDDILSTYWQAGSHTSYAYMAGTSMATPHVSGALAALIARGFTTAQGAVDRLLASVDALSCGGNSPTPSTTTPANTTTTRAAPGASRGGGTPAAAPAGPLSTVNVPRLASPAAAAGRSPATTAEGRASAAGEVGAAAPTNASHKGGSSLPAAALVVAVICLGAAAVALVSRARRDRLGLATTTHRPPG